LGIWLGYPLADPVVDLLITVAILWLVWQPGMTVLIRALDGVNPKMITEFRHAAAHASGVQAVTEMQAGWGAHHLRAEMSIGVAPELSVAEGHAIVIEVRHQLLHHVRYLREVSVHVDPLDKAGEEHHRIVDHVHDGLPTHSH
jgi:divalent metal cation (Fe/Co/Zn/Cd) transporter